MNIFSLINQERTIARKDAGSKKKVLEILSDTLAPFIPNHSREKIFEHLIARERLGSTGLGSGVAIPHCRLHGLEAPLGAMLTLRQAVSFDSADNQDVDILFCLVVPEDADEKHLQILSGLAELFIDAELCAQLRDADDDTELLNTLHHWQQNAAA